MSGEGAQGVVRFLAAFPWSVKNSTLYCGPVAVVGNTYAAMPGQGDGLGEGFAACAQTRGVAGVCYNKTAAAAAAAATTGVRCVRATELAELVAAAGRAATCKGFSSMCTLY